MIKTIYYIIKCSRDVDCVQYTIYRIHEIYRIDMNISGSHAMHLQVAVATPWYIHGGIIGVCQDIWIICDRAGSRNGYVIKNSYITTGSERGTW